MPISSLAADHDFHRLAVATALRELDRTLNTLLQSLAHESVLVSVEGASTTAQALRRACDAYAAIDYTPDQEVNTAPTCLGVIGAPASVLAQAQALNRAKARLRDCCKPIQNRRMRIPVKDGEGGRIVKSMPLVRVILRELQHSDLNLLAAYRRIPVLSGRLERVAYTRATTRAVYRKSRQEIATLLQALPETSTVTDDRRRLSRLPPGETHLALVKEHYGNMRANLWFDGLDARHRGRAQVGAELPLIFPLGHTRRLPDIQYPAPGTPTDAIPTRKREGKLLEDPYLESLPVYRYRPEFR